MIVRIAILCALMIACGGPNIRAGEVKVHAAASLRDALQEIGAMYQNRTDDQVIFNFAASSILVRQIEQGAPGDLIVSADDEKMDQLKMKGLIRKDTRKALLSNSLVIVVPRHSNLKISNPADLASIKGNIAIAEPRTVPAGIYAKEYLVKTGIWQRIADRIVPAENVRAVLAVVESGNADAGVVYKTDAAISREVRIALEVPPTESPKIQYPMAILNGTENFKSAEAFYKFLSTSESLSVFRKHGFLILQ